MLKKVVFTDEVKKLIRKDLKSYNRGDFIHVKSKMSNLGQSYTKDFLKEPYLIVEYNDNNYIGYKIVEPINIKNLFVNKDHVVPYKNFEIEIDDKLFNWSI